MGDLIQNKDWSATPLGPPDTWPQSLRTTLSIILKSRFPQFLWWGPQLICFYNDAYRPSLGIDGKHPGILGEPAETAWSEIWHIIKPLIHRVMSEGASTWSEDQLIPIFRNGKMEDAYWTFSYSPVHDESGKPAGVLVTCNETTSKVCDRLRLEKSEEKLKLVIEASELGTWELNIKTGAVQYSDRYLQILGYPDRVELTHQQIVRHLHPEDLPVREAAFRKSFETGVLHYESRVIWNDQSIHWIEGRGKVFFDEQGKPDWMAGTLRDITEEKRYRQEQKTFTEQLELLVQERTHLLQESNEKLEKSILDLQKMNAELQSFAYVSSHDLQEPLRKIQAFAGRIKEKEEQNLSELGRDYLQRMQDAARRMQTLIEDLLMYSRTNTTERIFKKVKVATLLEEVKNDFRETLQEKQGVMEIGEMGELELIPFQFRQLLHNLIGNAVKFSKPEVPPFISVTGRFVTGSDAHIAGLSPRKNYFHFCISDNGIGFSPQYKERIFEVFQRLHGRSEYPGTGIGLAIVKKIVDNHNGIIEASGEEGVGAQFDIYIPVR